MRFGTTAGMLTASICSSLRRSPVGRQSARIDGVHASATMTAPHCSRVTSAWTARRSRVRPEMASLWQPRNQDDRIGKLPAGAAARKCHDLAR